MIKKVICFGLIFLMIFNIFIFTSCGKCENCDGRQTVECSDCWGEGKELCSLCDGIGNCFWCKNKNKYTTCTKCKGTGVITNPITWQEFKCPTCNGKHIIETTCKDCNNTRKCQKCSGIGVQSGAKSCANCAGSGRVDCPSCE